MAKYKSKLKKNSKYNTKGKRFLRNASLTYADIESCKKKTSYNKSEANQMIKKLKESSSVFARKYVCPKCGDFHISKEKR